MANHINQLVKQAITTFSGKQSLISKNLETLKFLLDKTTAADIGFTDHEVLKPETWKRPDKAPVSYIDLYEDDYVSLGIFVLGEGSKLPLHDHPCMHGLIKVIAGTLKITSYTVTKVNHNELEAECRNPINLQFMDSSSLLSPESDNLHEIECVNGVGAFLDILAPPYDSETLMAKRDCSYYKPIRQIGVNKMLLHRIQCPSWFYCDSFPYKGPPILGQFVEQQESENFL